MVLVIAGRERRSIEMSAVLSSSLSPTLRQPIRVGVAGLGRMGLIHALHILELGAESGLCELTCVSTTDRQAADTFLSLSGTSTPVFDDIHGLAESGLCDVAIVATNTSLHREHALLMIRAGQRIFAPDNGFFSRSLLPGRSKTIANSQHC
jgi:hypothetical protein